MKFSSRSPLEVGRECYLHVEDRIFVVEILGLSKDAIWISFPRADSLPEGTGVDLEFYENDTFSCYHARVVVGPKKTRHGIMLERAESASPSAYRRDWRVPTDLTVWIEDIGKTRREKGHMMNLTSDGALVTAPEPLGAGDLVNMIFQLPESDLQSVLAQVVYTDGADERGAFRFGLRFVEVGRSAREAVTWYLYDRIRDLYTNELADMYPRASSRRPVAAQSRL